MEIKLCVDCEYVVDLETGLYEFCSKYPSPINKDFTEMCKTMRYHGPCGYFEARGFKEKEGCDGN